MAKGIFISFEGSEACGKSSRIDRLKTRLEVLEVEMVASREPGGTILKDRLAYVPWIFPNFGPVPCFPVPCFPPQRDTTIARFVASTDQTHSCDSMDN